MEKGFTLHNGMRYTMGCCRANTLHKLPVTDWLNDIPLARATSDLVEVQFKNTRKCYYHNSNKLPLKKGDKVVVSGNRMGYDLGEVTLVGLLVERQMAKYHIDLERYEIGTIYRLANEEDIELSEQYHALEQSVMVEARQVAHDMDLAMKIGDVEYQADGTKAIFYYIAEGRINFRELIKVYAERFHIRIEMKQIGARQEAGRIGGTGDCGRELCCSTWMTDFTSVSTDSIRLQNLSLNTTKMTGQCAKLKCCYNYEVPIYEDAMKDFPTKEVVLRVKTGKYYLVGCRPLQKELTYSSNPSTLDDLHILPLERVNSIIAMNKQGKLPDVLGGKEATKEEAGFGLTNDDDNIERFDSHSNHSTYQNRPNNNRNRPFNRNNNYGKNPRNNNR